MACEIPIKFGTQTGFNELQTSMPHFVSRTSYTLLKIYTYYKEIYCSISSNTNILSVNPCKSVYRYFSAHKTYTMPSQDDSSLKQSHFLLIMFSKASGVIGLGIHVEMLIENDQDELTDSYVDRNLNSMVKALLCLFK